MSDQLRVNGNLIGWGSHIFKVDGERWFGVVGVDWDHERSRVFGWGMNRAHAPIARTGGKYTPGAIKVTMFKHTAVALRKKLATLSSDGRSYGNAEFPMFLQIVEGIFTSTTEFVECCVTKPAGSAEESPDPTKEVWEFMAKKILEDGLTLYDSSEEG